MATASTAPVRTIEMFAAAVSVVPDSLKRLSVSVLAVAHLESLPAVPVPVGEVDAADTALESATLTLIDWEVF